MREIRTSGSMRGGRKRAFARRACLLLYKALALKKSLERMYRRNAERILLQSVAASTMSAHLAAAALGYAVWWITAIGQDEIQRNIRPLLGIPDALDVVDIMCFGPPLKPSYKRWKKTLDQIVSWDLFNHQNLMTEEEIEDWVKTRRHKVMYRDQANVD